MCWRNMDLVMIKEIENNYIPFLTLWKLSVLCAGGISAHFSLHVLDSMSVLWNAWILEAVTGQSKPPLTCKLRWWISWSDCVQRMSNTLHIVDIWSNFIGSKTIDAEDWQVKNMFWSWQSPCRASSKNRCLLQKLKTLHREIKTVLGLCLLRSMALWLDLSHQLLFFFCRPHFCFHAWADISIHSPNTMHSVQMRPQQKLA